MGTYISILVKNAVYIHKVNNLWNKENVGYESTFHLSTRADMTAWLANIHTDPKLKHLRYIKSVEEIDEVFPSWGLGTFQVKITMGDYLCSEMARRYLRFFIRYGDKYFIENPINDEYVKELLEDMSSRKHVAESCAVECPSCKDDFRSHVKRANSRAHV